MDFKGFYDEIIFDVDRSILKSYTGKQGDTKSRGLYVTVTQKNAVIEDLTGLSMRLFYEKPDKTRGFIDGVVDGNKFRIDYTNQMYAVPGVVKAELRLMGADGEIITAKTFKILVDSSIADGSIVSENERGILDRAFELAEDIIPRLELLDVELLEDVQDEMLGARHSETKDVTYDSLGQRLDAAEQDLLDHKAEYTSNRQQDQLKVAKVEKELNDYKATMQQVNINQEPKQKATGYGVISLPPNAAEGQVSGVVRGLTATNLVKNGDFSNGTTGWRAENGNITANNNIVTHTINNWFRGDIKESGKHKAVIGNKLFVRAKMRVTNSQCQAIYLIIEYLKNDVWVGQNLARLENPVENQWYNFFAVLELRDGFDYEDYRLAIRHQYEDENTALGKQMEVKEVIMIDLTAHGLDYLTAEEVNTMLPNWFDGTKSTVGVIKVKSVGKNLFDKNRALKGYILNFTNGVQEPYSTPSFCSNFIRVDSNEQYYVTGFLGKGYAFIAFYDSNKNFTRRTPASPRYNILISDIQDHEKYIRITVYNSANGPATWQDIDDVLNNLKVERGSVATPYDPYRESNAYVVAADKDTGEILELRSLPNGTKDELCVSTGKLIKRVSDEVKTWNLTWSRVEGADTNDYYGIRTYDLNSMPSYIRHSVYMSKGEHTTQYTSGYSNKNDLVYYDSGHGVDFRFKVPKSAFTNNWTLAETQAWLEQNQVTLTYQLAEPVEIPVQVSGTLTSYPNGTIYIERILPDAGVYTDKITILHQDAPIKAIEKLSKVDFMTGVETELDVSEAVIAEDKLSFTHPELSEGDIVFFEYEYDIESTEGETEVEYYDSRYVVKDDVTGKFYKWNVKVSNGTPTIEVVEV